MALIGILASMAIPRYSDMKRRAIAASIVGDVHAIRVAAFSYYTEKSQFPPDAGPGVVPPELITYLPRDFQFALPDYTYDYESWSVSGGLPGSQATTIIAVSITTQDPLLAEFVLKLAGRGYVPFASGNKVTFFVTGVADN
jgi:type II secretory pathway pseudopilin PulG